MSVPPALTQYLERLPDAVVLADDDARYLFLNSAARRLMGVGPDQATGLSVADFAEDADETAAAWRAFLQAGEQQGEFPLRRLDGSVVPVEFNAIANYGEGIHMSIMRDASDRKRVDESLRRNEERFTKAFIATPAPTNIRVLKTGAFLEINEAFSNALGYWRADVIGRTADDLGLWADSSLLKRVLGELGDGGQEVRTRAGLRTKDGTEREFSVRMRRVEMHGEPHVIAVYWELGED